MCLCLLQVEKCGDLAAQVCGGPVSVHVSVHVLAADGTHGGVGLDEALLQRSGLLPATGRTQTLQLTHLPAQDVRQRADSAHGA